MRVSVLRVAVRLILVGLGLVAGLSEGVGERDRFDFVHDGDDHGCRRRSMLGIEVGHEYEIMDYCQEERMKLRALGE